MCKYCEKTSVENIVDLLPSSEDIMACISGISPIAKRRYPDCGGELYVEFDESTVSIPIKYCPICGRKL